MARLFGTDGVRGVANVELTCELATDIGRATAYVLTRDLDHRAKFLIGQDTRISGDMLTAAFAAGACSVGVDILSLNVVPTPAVAFLVGHLEADAGIVISASHNPVKYNGIKIFNALGYKLADEIEDEIEQYVFARKGEIELKTGVEIGKITRAYKPNLTYVDHVAKSVEGNLEGIRAIIDCANGAASDSAKRLFETLGDGCILIANKPDGRNINDGVGSTHLKHLAAAVLEHKADIGIAFDGDADRCLAVDENGRTIDGDEIIAIFAKYLKEKGQLDQNTAVVTVMTNLGFMDYCRKNGINAVRTAVGDRYVLEEMRKNGYCLGGEQSGHIILGNHSTTGDGQMTAALLLSILKQSGGKASALLKDFERFPQVQVNVEADAAAKARFREDEELAGFIEARQQDLFETGRVLVRVSGTEPLIRILVEGRDETEIAGIARAIENKIKERI